MEHKERNFQLSILGRSIRADLEYDEMILPGTSQKGDKLVTGTATALDSGGSSSRGHLFILEHLTAHLTHPTPTSLTHGLSLAQTLSAPSAQLAIRLVKSPHPG